MISFCQDLSISYEYHVYQNKTVKKVIHKRNGSNISQKTITKSSKLSVVSKRPNENINDSFTGIKVTDPQTKIPIHLRDRFLHQRSMSNQLQSSRKIEANGKIKKTQYSDQKNEIFQFKEVMSMQIPKTVIQQRIQRPSIIIPKRQQNFKKIYNFFNTPKILKPASVVPIPFSSRLQYKESQNKYQNTSISEKRTVKIGQSVQRLNQSIDTTKYYKKSQNNSIQNNHSRTNSFTVNENQNNKNIAYSFVYGQDSESLSSKKPYKFDWINQSSNFISNQVEKKCLNISSINPEQTDLPIRQFLWNQQKQENLQKKIIFPHHKRSFSAQHQQNKDVSILFDATSIVSQSLPQERDDQLDSVVEQRNFFFQKQDKPTQIFKKSIQKYIFLQSGYISNCERWILFKNVQQKQNKKFYSIKQFSTNHENLYMDEYQIYLALKVQQSKGHQEAHQKNSLILEFYNALSNNQQNKLHLIKQTFKYPLKDYIHQIRKKYAFSYDRKQQLEIQNKKLSEQIKKIFQFLNNRQMLIKGTEIIQVEDFVVCENEFQGYQIKFHSLHKIKIKPKNDIQSMKQEICHKINQSKKLISHKADKWCFHHTCQHNNYISKQMKEFQQVKKESPSIQTTKKASLQHLYKQLSDVFSI